MSVINDRFISLTYDTDLIKILSKNIKLGAFASNLSTPLIVSVILLTVIDLKIIVIWMSVQLLVLGIRLYIGNRLNQAIKKSNEEGVEKYFRNYLVTIFITGSLWGLMGMIVIYYGNEVEVLIMLTILIGLTSGSISTLGAVFHAMWIFTLSIFVPVIFGLFFIKYNDIYLLEGILSIGYIVVTTKAFYTTYMIMKKNVEKQYELEIMNKTLEERIRKEVEKNSEKERFLLQQNRLAQMGELISMIAHQWRQPLSSISSIGAALEIKAQIDNIDNEFIVENARKIKTYTNYLSETIDDFRQFFKDDKKKYKSSLVKIVENALSIIGDELKNNHIEIIKKFETEKEICIYKNELQQVILNIIKNAEDALLEHKIEDPKIFIYISEEKDRYCLKIEDNAGGIPDDIKDRIFEPYFSTKLKKDGTGLGLYMSKIIIEKHCLGKLYCTNTDNGAMFIIELYKENIESKDNDEY